MTESEKDTLRDLVKEIKKIEAGVSGLRGFVNTAYGTMHKEKTLKALSQAPGEPISSYQHYLTIFEEQMSVIKKRIEADELIHNLTTLRESIEETIVSASETQTLH